MGLFKKLKKAIILVFKKPKGFSDYCSSLICALVKSKKSVGLPVYITIEATNLCNLNCPVCETGAGLLRRQKGMMGLSEFNKIIDKIHKHTNSILFYFMGEPFLNKNAYDMIKYAKNKGIYITACTSGDFINAEKLVESGIDEVSFQIGGLTEETHSLYRVGSKLNEIIKNIKEVVEKKRIAKKDTPKVVLGFIVMKQNESQINNFYKLAKELKVDEARVLEPCVRSWEQAKKFLPSNEKYWFYDKVSFKKGILKPKRIPRNRCNWLYFSCVILYNGDIVPCCRDVQGDYVMGNMLEKDFISIWNGRKYREFRKAISEKQNKMDLCKLCSSFTIPNLH